MTVQTIPVVSLNDYRAGGAAREKFVQTAGLALEETGFFALEDHGVDSGLIRRAYGAAEAFFSMDDAAKRQYEIPGLKGQRGFTSFGREHAKDSPAPDLKEFWHVGRELPADHHLADLYQRNVWPETPADFRPVFEELFAALDGCAAALLEALSLYLDQPPDLLPSMARDGNTILRIIHYPPAAPGAKGGGMRAAPHEDINLITLLCEATAGGLELQQRDGSWLPIQALPGQIIVDSGDMIQNLTNGLLKSTTHRVVNPDTAGARRFSMPFFVHPRSEVCLAPLEEAVRRTGGEPRFPSLTAGEYLAQRLREIGLA